MNNNHELGQFNSEKIDLSQFEDEFNQAEVQTRDFEQIPDGRYQAVVERVELTRTKNTGTPMLKWSLRILGPQCRGRMIFRNNVIASPANIKWLKTDLVICGLNLQRLSDLSNNLEKLLDIKLEIFKKTKGENENVYFNKQIIIDDNYNAHMNDDLSDIPF